jgi:hypothetical protein
MRTPHLVLACLVLHAVTGCASEGVQVSAHTQSVAYRERLDPALILRADPPNCAVLPALTPTTYGGLAQLTDITFLLSLRAAAPGASVLTSAETIARMNDAGVVGDWQSLARDYASSGAMDRDRISKIGKALGARHLVLPMLGYITTNAEQQLQPFGITIGATVWVTVWASIHVWDAERGTVEWTSAGSCCIALEVAVAAGYPIHQALRKTYDEMLTDLIENRHGSVVHEKISPQAMRAMTEAATGVPSAPAPVTSAK